MNPNLSSTSRKTCGKELAHVVMHDPDDEEARQHRGTREVEAESVALTLIWTRRSGWVRLEVVPTPLEVLVQ